LIFVIEAFLPTTGWLPMVTRPLIEAVRGLASGTGVCERASTCRLSQMIEIKERHIKYWKCMCSLEVVTYVAQIITARKQNWLQDKVTLLLKPVS
jgi:hypothetical protein